MKTISPLGYHHNGFMATHALGHMMYGSTTIVISYIYINCIYTDIVSYQLYTYIYTVIYIVINIYNIYIYFYVPNNAHLIGSVIIGTEKIIELFRNRCIEIKVKIVTKVENLQR